MLFHVNAKQCNEHSIIRFNQLKDVTFDVYLKTLQNSVILQLQNNCIQMYNC